MARFLIPASFIVLLLLFWFTLDRMGKGEYNPRNIPTEFLGKPAPEINVPDLYKPDTLVRTTDLKGQVWLFNVWGTWCPECWKEHEYLVHLAKRKGVPIIGINWRDDAAEAKAMLKRLGNPFQQIAFDPKSDAVIDWGVYGAPETFLIDAEGIVRVKHTGAMNSQVWREKFQSYFVTDGGA